MRAAAIEADLHRVHTEDDAMLAVCWPRELALTNKLIAAAFDVPRDPRSAAYRDGARSLLLFKLVDRPLKNPFEVGTAHADAWWAGRAEGMHILKLHLEAGLPA